MTMRMRRRTSTKSVGLFLLKLPAPSACSSGKPKAQSIKKDAAPHADHLWNRISRSRVRPVPGASVFLALKSAPAKKLQHQISSPRGEFTFRVPPGPQAYVITATLKGFQVAREDVEIQEQEQINATLLLIPESKNKGR